MDMDVVLFYSGFTFLLLNHFPYSLAKNIAKKGRKMYLQEKVVLKVLKSYFPEKLLITV